MDAIDILGSLLGHKSSRTGAGADVLNDIFKGGSRAQPRSNSSGSATLRPGDIQREADELEDLLNVANERHTSRRKGPSQSPQTQPPRPDTRYQPGGAASEHHDSRSSRYPSSGTNSENDRALVLVRAMVNAAKSDGQVDKSEQQSILARLGDTSRESIQFLNDEFAKPLDVREFAWSVPIGMEQQVYTMSLITIDLDTRRETSYLRDLAHGLRIPEEVRNQIHQQLGAPSIT